MYIYALCYGVKSNLELSLCTLKAYGGRRGIVPCILKLGTRRRSVVTFAPWRFYPWGKNFRYPGQRIGPPEPVRFV